MLQTLLCIMHFVLTRREPVSYQPRPNETVHTAIEFYGDNHVHFHISREEARILFGCMPMHLRNEIRSMHTVSFLPEIRAAMAPDPEPPPPLGRYGDILDPGHYLDTARGLSAFWYYDDSPNYSTAIIFGEDIDAVREVAEEYHAEMHDGIEEQQYIYSACEIRQIATLKDYLRCMEDAGEHINVDELY